jgi:pimeloyl-ACP methyl ester carboxylesterase
LASCGASTGKAGAQYAHRFADRVRALVLDAPSDPRLDAPVVARQRACGFEGDGHTAMAQSTCIDRHVEQYLVDLEARPAQTRCAA